MRHSFPTRRSSDLASLNSLSDDALSYLFGLGVAPNLYKDWLTAATAFSKIRERLEVDEQKLKSLRPSSFHKSTKKQLFKTSLERAATEKHESRVLLPLINDLSISPSQSLYRLILVCYSFQQAQYDEVIKHGLENILPRLIQVPTADDALRQEMKDLFSQTIRDVWGGRKGHELIHNILNNSDQIQTPQGQLVQLNPEPVYKGFKYVDAMDIQPLLDTFPGILHCHRWSMERASDHPGFHNVTKCVSAFVGTSISGDIEFRIRTSNADGWRLITKLDFRDSIVIPAGF